ncbi:Calcium-transporting ATPase 12, plasma membrane-type [Camellia lanceoleosa]|uniref:Calcium-transporting ATPase 12, plasma membrane-type n=1 Tax=Camellia lanceoleosa TaxID=1840588 RepID=A0ACC0F6W0_9ERIC|nr:Calcium-transporting ATPase 12, plasma membrane-type [Camellia lanceoleosa]
MASNLNSSSDYGVFLNTIATSAATFTKAQKRWRIAYSAIYFALYIAKDTAAEKRIKAQNKAQKRWRLAYAAIYSSRVMVSLFREIVTNTTNNDPPCTILDIEPVILDGVDENTHLVQIEEGDDSCFPSIDRSKLAEMVKEKALNALAGFGGVEGLTKALDTDPENGIHGDEHDVRLRQSTFGMNTYQKPPPKGFIYFVVEAFKDITILILLGCAALQARQFDKLSKISSNIKIDVARDGRRQEISIFDIVVGDVVFLMIGDQIPADGLFLQGHSLLVDESSMTGESDHVEVDGTQNPFLLSGSKVADGYARMVVTSVGMNTAWGNMMSSISRDSNDQTPLQARLNKLTSTIGKVGLAVAFLVLVVLLIRYFTGNTEDENGNQKFNGSKTQINAVFNSVVHIVAAAVTIVVVAIPEGLPLAVTLTLAYSMKRMMADQAMVRKLPACETMGSATVICTDKTGTLTLNQMKLTKLWLGLEDMVEHYSEMIAKKVLELFHQGVGLNTTGSVCKPVSGSIPEFFGSPTEKAILSWAVLELGMDMEKLKQTYTILHVETFNSEKKTRSFSEEKVR